jgi:outer membrane protein OmpA-like peptidoglycan-associated protein
MKGRPSTTIPSSGGRGGFVAWFVLAVLISLVAHLLFFDRSRVWKISGFSAESYDMIVPRTFRMNRVEIDPATLEDPVKQPQEIRRDPGPIDLPPENPSVASRKDGKEENASVMQVPSIETDRPAIGENRGELAVPKLDATTMSQLLEGSRNAPALPVDPLKDLAEGSGGTATTQAFSSLDSLLEGKERLTSATAPILMPTDLLFGYDSTTLKPEAAKSLEKLGTLIRRNGNARFRIEGHTDSFGSDEYNYSLSLRRAEEVKAWLVGTMGIDPSRVSTAGLGKSRLLVPATGSIEEQQLNRRVEIVITGTGNP